MASVVYNNLYNQQLMFYVCDSSISFKSTSKNLNIKNQFSCSLNSKYILNIDYFLLPVVLVCCTLMKSLKITFGPNCLGLVCKGDSYSTQRSKYLLNR